jgi:hypothetical protein
MNYKKQAKDFLEKVGGEVIIGEPTFDYFFEGDKETLIKRYIFPCELKRNGKSYSFKFGQSIVNSGKIPSEYSILSTLTKYNPGSFENFCYEYGYDNDSIKAQKIWKNVKKEWKGVKNLFGDVLEQLKEIE